MTKSGSARAGGASLRPATAAQGGSERNEALRASPVRSLSEKGISRRRAERGGFEPPWDRRPQTVFESP